MSFPVREPGAGDPINQIEIIDVIVVIPPGDRHVHLLPERERVGEIKAPVGGAPFFGILLRKCQLELPSASTVDPSRQAGTLTRE